jgi:hypothetical protein
MANGHRARSSWLALVALGCGGGAVTGATGGASGAGAVGGGLAGTPGGAAGTAGVTTNQGCDSDVAGNVTAASQADLALLGNVRSIGGTLTITGGVTDLSPLGCLASVGGSPSRTRPSRRWRVSRTRRSPGA